MHIALLRPVHFHHKGGSHQNKQAVQPVGGICSGETEAPGDEGMPVQ